MLSKPPPAKRKPNNERENNLRDFLFKPRYTNTLPDVPYEGKFLKLNFGTVKNRFGVYKPTQMEITHRRMMMCDLDVGVDIDLVDPETYVATPNTPVDEKDSWLLNDESASSMRKMKRSAQHAQAVPFMRRTEYISAEFNRYGVGADRQETKVGYHLLKNLNPDDIFYRDRESQVAAIEKTFEEVKKPMMQHPHKPGVIAVEELPIFPDFDLWKHIYAEVTFDNDPAVSDLPKELQQMALENSLLMGFDGQDNVIGHFCPNGETLTKIEIDEEMGRDYDEEQTYDFPLNRDYIWNIKSKNNNDFEDDFAFYQRNGNMYYVEMGLKVRLGRLRRQIGERKPDVTMQINYREYNQKEKAEFEKKLKGFLDPYDLEEKESSDEASDKSSEDEEEKTDDKDERAEIETPDSPKANDNENDEKAENSEKSDDSDNDDPPPTTNNPIKTPSTPSSGSSISSSGRSSSSSDSD